MTHGEELVLADKSVLHGRIVVARDPFRLRISGTTEAGRVVFPPARDIRLERRKATPSGPSSSPQSPLRKHAS